MSLAITAFQQIFIMFILIVAGIFSYKTKLIDQPMSKKLSDLVLLLVNPLVIFMSYQRKFEPSLLTGLLISLILALVSHLFSIILSVIVFPKKNHEAEASIERFAVIYSNCGFIGIPLVYGIFGSKGVFFLTSYMTISSFFVWTHGAITISGKSDRNSILKSLLSPPIIATVLGFAFFMSRIILPNILGKALNYIGDMNTPLAMMVAGVTIAQTDVVKLFGKLRLYYIAFLKLLLIPISMVLLFSRFHQVQQVVLLTSILATACPTAANINLFSLRFGKDYRYASEIFTLSTILSIVSIPLVMILANYLI
jgi:predicted permease